jgi:uncharacterized protein
MNHLSNETSPYLIQHRENPVDWYPYGNEALNKAKKEKKLIFLSIGYSACHWCHVMAHESFENEDIAKILNTHYISIKVDREERPDLDQVFQSVIQLLGKNGGWPLSVFLTPEGEPFFAGTYFPSTNKYGRISFPELLVRLVALYSSKYADVQETVHGIKDALNKLYGHVKLEQNSTNFVSNSELDSNLSSEISSVNKLNEATSEIMLRFDSKNGGFLGAPKFPNFPIYIFLLRQLAENLKFENEEYLQLKSKIGLKDEQISRIKADLKLTFDKISDGGIYDQIGGGLHRYSVDDHWLVPHFEKMLYDNAMALVGYTEAFQFFGDLRYKQVVKEIIEWLIREMYLENIGFYSTLDADSEKEEGKYYVWKWDEILKQLTSEEFELIKSIYKIKNEGNFENHSNIIERFPSDLKKDSDISLKLDLIRGKLLKIREKRVYPHRDEKIITGWNGLALHGLFSAYKIFSKEPFGEKILQIAQNISKFIRNEMIDPSNYQLYRIFRLSDNEKTRKIEGMLDDYAYFIQALLDEFEITKDEKLFELVIQLTNCANEKFWDSDKNTYYYSPKETSDILVRPNHTYDAPFPNPIAVMIENLIQIHFYTSEDRWVNQAQSVINKILPKALNSPTGHASFLISLQWLLYGSTDVVAIKNNQDDSMNLIRKAVNQFFIPRLHYLEGTPGKIKHKIIKIDDMDNKNLFLMECTINQCSPPFENLIEFEKYLRKLHKQSIK